MQLKDLTEDFIEEFAGETIFDRGYEYYTQKLVYDLNYATDTDSLEAQVSGNYGEYDVSITTADGELMAECTCPYEGYPCKHVAAVLLTFLHNRDRYLKQAKTDTKAVSALAKKLQMLPQEQLVELLMSYSKKYPDVKRDLMVRLEGEKEVTFTAIQKQITHAFPSIESHQYSTAAIAKQLRPILKSVEQASPAMQIKVYWAVIDRTLEELNAYGIDDEPLENVAIDVMESLAAVFEQTDQFKTERAEIIAKLLKYYQQGNFGITDWVYDTAVKLCKEKADYQIIIHALEKDHKKSAYSSHHDAIAELYRAMGDTDAERKTLEAHLQDGMDYWRLAGYWFEQGDEDKALEVVRQGLEKGQGRKEELYQALQQHYQEQDDYASIFALLERKIAKKELESRSLKNDQTYQCLWAYCVDHHDYERQKYLLQLRLTQQDIDLDFYKEAEHELHPADWQQFEPQIITTLQNQIQQQPKTSFGFGFFPYTSTSPLDTLAAIYHYKKEPENLFATVKTHTELLRKYEALLLPRYPHEYLAHYRSVVNQYIAGAGGRITRRLCHIRKRSSGFIRTSCTNLKSGQSISRIYGQNIKHYGHCRRNWRGCKGDNTAQAVIRILPPLFRQKKRGERG